MLGRRRVERLFPQGAYFWAAGRHGFPFLWYEEFGCDRRLVLTSCVNWVSMFLCLWVVVFFAITAYMGFGDD